MRCKNCGCDAHCGMSCTDCYECSECDCTDCEEDEEPEPKINTTTADVRD